MENNKRSENKVKMGTDDLNKTPNGNSNASEDNSQATTEDLEEFESVSNEIDSINGYLDSLENNVDNIKDQLMTILTSNREIVQEIQAEKERSGQGGSNSDDQKPMET